MSWATRWAANGRALFRLARVLAHVCSGYVTIRTRFGGLPQPQRQAHVQAWAQGFLKVLGVRLVVQGVARPAGVDGVTGMLMVANHISWLDILVLLATRPVRFVSKSEVAAWPFLGLMATEAGTLYIERSRKRDALRMVHTMVEALGRGDCVGVFPEGTVSNGRSLLPFHANLLQAALSADVPVLPVAFVFVDPITGQPTMAASYEGEATLASSVLKLLRSPPIEVRVRFLAPDAASGRDRRDWSNDLHTQVSKAHRELIN